MQYGDAALEAEQWDVAIDYFEKAQRLAPDNPQLMLKLAVAYDEASHRDAMALLWYGSFLEANPSATQADQVRARMIKLEVRTEAQIRGLIRAAIRSIEELSVADKAYQTQYWYVAVAQAAFGQLKEAEVSIRKSIAAYHKQIGIEAEYIRKEGGKTASGAVIIPSQPVNALHDMKKAAEGLANAFIRYGDLDRAIRILTPSYYGRTPQGEPILRSDDPELNLLKASLQADPNAQEVILLLAGDRRGFAYQLTERSKAWDMFFLSGGSLPGAPGRCCHSWRVYAQWKELTSLRYNWADDLSNAPSTDVPRVFSAAAAEWAEGLRLVRWLSNRYGRG